MKKIALCGFALMMLPWLAAGKNVAGSSIGSTELQTGWRMMQADKVAADGPQISARDFDLSAWYAIPRMPATVLQILEDNGVYKDLYFGKNLVDSVPQDLWKHDWWYRTTFAVPEGGGYSTLIFDGINYRADIWVNGQLVADHTKIVGMYNQFELDVTKLVHAGADNVLAVRVTPEQKVGGPAMLGGPSKSVELADSWLDWINWKYIGIADKFISMVADRNAGVWKKVYLTHSGEVSIRNPYVTSDLPLPALAPASLGVYADLHNFSGESVTGTLAGEITRPGKPAIHLQKQITLAAGETREVALEPAEFPALKVNNPDLWWPYTWGKPNLYELKLDFRISGQISDAQSIAFGIRKITQHRDTDESFPKLGKGGNFYLQVNGRDYLIRGAAYTPDLLFKNDPERDRTVMRYSKDLGLNMLRWELKFADDDMLALADREGMPVMRGWMCCMQWESWDAWDAEDHRVAHESMMSQIRVLRAHPSAFIWANGSDGLPPDAVLNDYHQVLKDLRWQNAVVDTVAHRNRSYDGIHMAGPYTWYPPYFWFNEKSGPARGSSAEEGNNETIPPLESLRKFIPADKLWPINDTWYFHAGGVPDNNTLKNIQLALAKRYGPSNDVADFARKAQLAIYENVRAQFDTYAAGGWDTHKMMIFWMLDNHWPSFFGHLFDYYYKQGGGYFGAKKSLRPLTAIFDGYATGDRSQANIYLVNQSTEARKQLKVTARFYNLDGTLKHVEASSEQDAAAATSTRVLSLPRYPDMSAAYFVRLEVRNHANDLLAENVYWQSTTDDVLAGETKEDAFSQMRLKQDQWADFTALNQMPAADVSVTAAELPAGKERKITITLSNNSGHVAFFVRASVLNEAGGNEILPITYDDNYVTLFPHEHKTLEATVFASQLAGHPPVVSIEGYNVAGKTAELGEKK